jgi:hypothetical protein
VQGKLKKTQVADANSRLGVTVADGNAGLKSKGDSALSLRAKPPFKSAVKTNFQV